jgi:uncharacterized protein (DUF362 family)/Pyruvate/2-oxoacid:ferredoxin oxidoreductase delta subunit
MAKVFVRESSYDYKRLQPVIFELLDSFAGDSISQGCRVVIKPNLLAAAPPEKAIVTHPLVVRATVEYVIQKGGKPQISDSPAVGTFHKILRNSGYLNALRGLPVEYREFKSAVVVNTGRPFDKMEVAYDSVHADILINLPKLKTHSQMLLTLGIKNIFGCVVGMKKPEWHLRAGADREMFARLLVHIFSAVKPSFTILDGIRGMEGQGPGRSGTPRDMGVIMGSSDTAALDITVCRMLGIKPEKLLTNRIAIEKGMVSQDIEVDGRLPKIHGFRFPEISSSLFGPKVAHGFMRRHITQRPVCDRALCRLCGECWKYCPAGAITRSGKSVSFDYDACIRCYCCIEVCPHGALLSRETLIGKVARRLLRIPE